MQIASKSRSFSFFLKKKTYMLLFLSFLLFIGKICRTNKDSKHKILGIVKMTTEKECKCISRNSCAPYSTKLLNYFTIAEAL